MPKTIKTARGLARFAKAPYASRRKSLPRHSFETRQKALAIFQAGGSYKNCAKTLNIPVYTARDWHRSFLIGTFRAEHGATSSPTHLNRKPKCFVCVRKKASPTTLFLS